MDHARLTKGNSVSRVTYRLHLPPTPPHSSTTLSTLALIKTSPTLDSLLPLGAQLHFMMLSSSASAPMLVQDDGVTSGTSTVVTTPAAQSTPYDGLHSLVHWGVAPWFDSYVSSKQSLIEGPANTKKGNEAQMGKQAISIQVAELQVFPSRKRDLPSSNFRCYISSRTSRFLRPGSRSTRPSGKLSPTSVTVNRPSLYADIAVSCDRQSGLGRCD